MPQISRVHKIFVDVSFVNIVVPSSLAGIMMDQEDRWFMGHQKMVYALDNLHAEIMAIRVRLQMALKNRTNCVHLYSDCQSTLKYLQEQDRALDMFDSINMCRDLGQCFQELRLVFIKRLRNKWVDQLAKKERKEGLNLDVTKIPPSVISRTYSVWL